MEEAPRGLLVGYALCGSRSNLKRDIVRPRAHWQRFQLCFPFGLFLLGRLSTRSIISFVTGSAGLPGGNLQNGNLQQ